jgi:hypothetical protein
MCQRRELSHVGRFFASSTLPVASVSTWVFDGEWRPHSLLVVHSNMLPPSPIVDRIDMKAFIHQLK